MERMQHLERPERIDGKYVHKLDERNVLIGRLERTTEPDCFAAVMTPDYEHPFFFEHGLDHVPSMMLVEVGRQMGIAVSHMFYDVPLGYMFATRAYDIRFTDFAETRGLVRVDARVIDKRFRHGQLSALRLEGHFSQAGRALGSMGGEWLMLPAEAWRRLRARQQRRAV
jgi:2-oxo-3-(phosphooxy)propyl 3-oxoalkanoate synthase